MESVCAVELTEIRSCGETWWSLGFEATGPGELMSSTLHAAAALVFTLVLVLSGSITARDDSVARVGRIPVGVAAAGVDLAALALAAAGVWELRTALTRQAASGSLDPLTVCAPTLAVLAFALASVRLVPSSAGWLRRSRIAPAAGPERSAAGTRRG